MCGKGVSYCLDALLSCKIQIWNLPSREAVLTVPIRKGGGLNPMIRWVSIFEHMEHVLPCESGP